MLSQRQFNLMHLKSGIKVDLIVRKAAEYRRVEFARRRQVDFAGGSELQQRDVRSLMDEGLDRAYLEEWAKRLGVDASLRKLGNG